jgi:hypothetical protein
MRQKNGAIPAEWERRRFVLDANPLTVQSNLFYKMNVRNRYFWLSARYLLQFPLFQVADKQESGCPAGRAAIRQAQHVQANASSGEIRATLSGGLGRSFSAAC